MITFREFINNIKILGYKEKVQYLKDRITQCKPMEGVKEITHALKHKYGFKTAIATSSLKESANINIIEEITM